MDSRYGQLPRRRNQSAHSHGYNFMRTPKDTECLDYPCDNIPSWRDSYPMPSLRLRSMSPAERRVPDVYGRKSSQGGLPQNTGAAAPSNTLYHRPSSYAPIFVPQSPYSIPTSNTRTRSCSASPASCNRWTPLLPSSINQGCGTLHRSPTWETITPPTRHAKENGYAQNGHLAWQSEKCNSPEQRSSRELMESAERRQPIVSHVTLPEYIFIGNSVTPNITYADIGGWRPEVSLKYSWSAVDQNGMETPLGTGAWQYIDEVALGKIIKVHITSKNGDNAVAQSGQPVLGSLPSIHHLSILGEAQEGETLTLSYDCIGGLDVPPYVAWFSGNREIIDARNCLSYTVTPDDRHKQILVEVTPVLPNGTPGATVSASTAVVESVAPFVMEVQIEGSLVVGRNLKAVIPPGTKSGARRRPQIRWYRVMRDGKSDVRLPSEPDDTYTLTSADIGHFIKVEYTPKGPDGQLGVPVSAISHSACLEERKPRQTYLQWQNERHMSDPRTGETLVLQIISEDQQMLNTLPHIRWFRNGYFVTEGATPLYTLGKADLGSRIMAECQVKGNWGHWQMTLESGQVLPGEPEVTAARIVGDFQVGGRLQLHRQVANGDSSGHIVWYRLDPKDNEMLEICSGRSSIELGPEDFDCCIGADFTPISTHGTDGETMQITSNDRIKAGIPVVTSYILAGRPMEGHELTAQVEVNYNGPPGDDIVAWYRGGTEVRHHDISDPHSMLYQCTAQDVGHHISFEYTPINTSGTKGRMVSVATTSPVLPAPPVILENVYVGRKMKAPFEVPESHHRVVAWFKTRNGMDWTKMYEIDETQATPQQLEELYSCVATADLLNHAVKCEVTQMGADGAMVHRQETPPAVVSLLPEFQEKLQIFLSAGMQAMDICAGAVPAALVLDYKQVQVLVNGKKMDGIKWNANAAFLLDTHQANKFKLRLSKDKELDCSLAEATHRDMTALLFRAFMGMGIKEIAERVVGKEAALDWRKGRYLNNRRNQKLVYHPEYTTEQPILRHNSLNTDQWNKPLLLSLDRPLSATEKTELEIFICRYGLSYWQARVALEYAIVGT